MARISLYIDEETLRKLENVAKSQQVSISKWVVRQIKEKIEPVYPEGYEELFGSVQDSAFTMPDSPSFEQDTLREVL
ncbi:MAG: hypothetical protein WCY01_11175 [Alkalispirochaeta sp.]